MESWSAGGWLLDLRAVGALAADADVVRQTGTVRVAASLAVEYRFTDIDAKVPRPQTLWNL